MSDAEKEDLRRRAVGGDPDAEKRLGVARCRTGECCGHANAPTTQPTGCATCPFLGWDRGTEEERCNLSDKAMIPVNYDGDTINAIPSNCPLWAGSQVVDLKQMAARR